MYLKKRKQITNINSYVTRALDDVTLSGNNNNIHPISFSNNNNRY